MFPSIPLKDPGSSSPTDSLYHLRAYYQFRIFYLSTQLDYLTASNGVGPWDKDEVEEQLTLTKERLKELYA